MAIASQLSLLLAAASVLAPVHLQAGAFAVDGYNAGPKCENLLRPELQLHGGPERFCCRARGPPKALHAEPYSFNWNEAAEDPAI